MFSQKQISYEYTRTFVLFMELFKFLFTTKFDGTTRLREEIMNDFN